MDNRYEIAEQNGMSREFADWFFDNKKAGCGNVWFMMMAAMWEGWEGRAAMLLGAEKTEPLHAVKDAPALDSSSRIAESLHADFQGAENAESRCTIQTAPGLDSSPKNAEPRCGNSPVIPDGCVMVPVEPTTNQWAAGMQAFDSGMDKVTRVYKAMLSAAPQQEVQ
ncbi:hypothetical protein JGT76_12425 [Enterobacter hormaechei]|uniref:hypothetical protein n=1 Tax=Enterobacter hormaechei TaxID=158836 RepID=UPI0018EC0963|nr:hypothetical protein [Enterobacter hormaechei]MBJ6543382.1 hypothetical protein [Enterobacter hormaechei]